jgi:murein DD-endopeptidase MepM/ murein hydrolase activator NlpD
VQRTRAADRCGAAQTARAAAALRRSAERGHALLPAFVVLAVLSYLGFFSYVAGLQSGLYRGSRAAAERTALEPVRQEVARQAAAARDARQRAAGGVRTVTDEVIRLQTRLVYLEALATRLSRKAAMEDLGFDFAIEPSLGGPEEAPDGEFPAEAALLGEVGVVASRLDDRWRQMSVLEDVLVRRKLGRDVVPEGAPVSSGYISSRFGNRIDPLTGRLALHKGVDFAGRLGTEIVAVAAGIVIWSGPRSGYGETVEIDHGNDRVTRYAHNAENLVAIGDVVTRGQPIARLGNTGRTTGPNLHFEVLRAGTAVDPADYMRE